MMNDPLREQLEDVISRLQDDAVKERNAVALSTDVYTRGRGAGIEVGMVAAAERLSALLASLRDGETPLTPDYKVLYHELLYQVAKKHPDETRHQTALRYLQTHENQCGQGGPVSAASSQETR